METYAFEFVIALLAIVIIPVSLLYVRWEYGRLKRDEQRITGE